jgi:hypothetical protein
MIKNSGKMMGKNHCFWMSLLWLSCALPEATNQPGSPLHRHDNISAV